MDDIDHDIKIIREALGNIATRMTEWDLRFSVGMRTERFNKALQRGVETNQLQRQWPNWVEIKE